MNYSETIEKLAAAISEEVYIDVAKWHLYLHDAKLDVGLAEQFYPLLSETEGTIDEQAVKTILKNTKVKVGGGHLEIALSDLIPSQVQLKLLDILTNFTER